MTDEKTVLVSCGFVFATTGALYTALARRAARSLLAIHPDAEIDLFTDQPIEDCVFAKVHRLDSDWFRPKMEALLRSRFDRTLYLDADIMVIGDMAPVFDLLDRFDLAVCHNRILNGEPSLRQHTRPLPDAFCSLNCGLMSMKKNAKTDSFIGDWQTAVRETGTDRDQPAFREMIYDCDLRFYVLPPGFNLLTFLELETWAGIFGAPRVLHSPALHQRDPGDPTTAFTMEEIVGPRHARQLRALLKADRILSPDVEDHGRVMTAPAERTLARQLRARLRRLVRRR